MTDRSLGAPARPMAGSAAAPRIDNRTGALWHVLACALFSLMAALAKLLGERLPSVEVAFARAFLGFLLLTPWLVAAGREAWRTRRLWLHVTRGTVGTLALICGTYAVTAMPLAEATSLSFTKPLFQVLLAACVLGETVGRHRWRAVLAGFLGVLVMLRPGLGMVQPGAFAALLGALCVAIVGVALRRLAQVERHLTILAYLGVVGSLVTGLPTAFVFVPPTGSELTLMLLMALAGMVGQVCLIRGYQVGEASALAAFDYTRLPFSALLGFLLFLELPDPQALLGALVIVLASLYLARCEAAPAKVPKTAGSP